MTPQDIERARRRFLTAPKMVVSIIPRGKLDLASKPDLPYTNATPAYARGAK
jgi:hypothetical protein